MKAHSDSRGFAPLISGLVMVFACTFAQGVPVQVQHAATINDASATSISQAFASPNTGGNLIVVALSWGNNTVPTVTDSVGNTYTLATTSFNPTGDQALGVFYAANVTAGANTVTANFPGSTPYSRLLIAEYSGVRKTTPVDVTATSQGTATNAPDNATSGTAATTNNGDLIFGAMENWDAKFAFTAGTGFTLRNSVSDLGVIETAAEDAVQTTAGSTAATFTFSQGDAYIAEMVAFNPSANGTPPSTPTGLSATANSSAQVSLTWTASSGPSGVAGYEIFRNGVQVGTTTAISYTDTGLAPSVAYTYAVAAYDSQGDVSPQSATAVATTPALPTPSYPLKVSANGRYLVDQNNQPFFITGDDAWSLFNELSNADVETYLADRAARGYNTLWIGLADNTYQSNPPKNYYGNVPFDGADFTNEDATYWAHIDYLLQRVQAYGITAWITPGFVGLNSSSGYLQSYLNSSDAVVTAYGAWLGNRYKSQPNIVWLLGGDCDPTMAGLYQKMNDLGNGIRSADTVHLMTIEAARYTTQGAAPGGGYSSLDAFPVANLPVPSWLTLNWIYNTAPTIVGGANKNYTRSPWLPPLLGEDWYEYEYNTTELQVRQEGYEAILAGAYLGRIFGNDSIWSFNVLKWENPNPPSWQSQLSSVGSVGEENLGALFRSRKHWMLAPDLNNTVLTAGQQSGATLALAARTSDGQSIIAYISAGQTVTINLAKISDSSAQAWWFNPQTAVTTLIGSFATTGSQNFTPPDGNDWVLVIDAASAGLPVPGSNSLIGQGAFQFADNGATVTIVGYDCSGGSMLTIPATIDNKPVTVIGADAFQGCNSPTSVTIPPSVTSIGADAFQGCSSLGSAYFQGNAPNVGSSIFANTASNFTVYYDPGATGFTNPWHGYTARVASPIPTLLQFHGSDDDRRGRH
ncbi:MAG: DUF4038 domain-containing protein [Opitutaceae bacterium]